jgi:HEAT repeat protein
MVGGVSEASLDQVISRGLEMTRTCSQPEDFDALWEHFETVRVYGREGFDAALRLLEGGTVERTAGCNLLSVLCNPDEHSWGHETAVAVCTIANDETDEDCCWSIAQALGFARDPIGIPVLAQLSTHSDSDVRFKVACALPSCAEFGTAVDPEIVDTLLRLMNDIDPDVRDWATFGLGQLLDADSRAIRDGFVGRLEDDHDDTRFEALIGLARRRDRRALPVVKSELEAQSVFRLAIEAARYLSDPMLSPSLVALRSWWDVDPALLEEAIESCDPHRQADRVRVLEELFVEIESMSEVSISACCDLYECHVSIEAQLDGQTLRWTLDSLIERAGGQLSLSSLILADLGSP